MWKEKSIYTDSARRNKVMAYWLALALLLFWVHASANTQPAIRLGNCPTDYAPKDSSCLCVAENTTSPSSTLLWKDPSKKTVLYGGESQTSLSLPFSAIETQFNGKAYTCQLIDGVHQRFITYTPKIAEPPSQPVLKDCPRDYMLPTDENAYCTCTTTNAGVPTALLVWEDPKQNALAYTSNQTSLRLRFSAIRAKFSERTYHCILRHITGDLNVSYTPPLVVKPEAPEIEGHMGSYTRGESVQLKCTVRGGVPETQKISFRCTNHPDRPDRIEGSQLTSSLVFTAELTDNNTQCDCYGTNDFALSSMYSFILHVGMTRGSGAQPRISLENCSKYVVSETASCTCVAENLGNSPSVLLWEDADEQTKGYKEETKSSMRLTLSKAYVNREYQCELLHSSGVERISYTLHVAERPSQPKLKYCRADNEWTTDLHASCTCETSSLGKPAALFVWDDPDHQSIAFTRNETLLAFPFAAVKEAYRGQKYRCILRHITGDLWVEYRPLRPLGNHTGDDGLSGGAVAGIVIGVLAFFGLVGCCCLCCYKLFNS